MTHRFLNRRAALLRSSALALAAPVWSKPATLGAAMLAAAGAAHSQTKLPRLVTLGGGITEMAYLLGAEGQLVGTDTTSLFPEAAQRTAKVGYMRALSAEGLLSLKPQAIIATTEAGPPVVIDQIRSAGVSVDLIEADHTWGEVLRKLSAVGKASGREVRARELAAQLDGRWAETLKQVAQHKGRKPRLLFILGHAGTPSVSGSKTAAHALIEMCGAVNAMSGFNGYRPMTAEAMASAAPAKARAIFFDVGG
ncbi:MAG: ABC transporter substrate-binding protein, partial [Brachymonas sp.]|nr:ABC transporter substrate-binding protein [Brachymonas sp.]